jgi:pyrophosphate--fructose-6-phosphate 1-phosphotransferase
MKPDQKLDLRALMTNPVVKNAISNISPGLVERRAFRPPRCEVFDSAYTALRDVRHYRFEIDPEAKRQLPRIIDNRVQTIIGEDQPDDQQVERLTRPRTIGIVFSGGPAPGGHPENRLVGFLMGPDGIIESEYIEITAELVDAYRNLGGFTMIRTGRTKIDTQEKMSLSRQTCRELGLDALVVVGGDDSNTNAAFLAQEMMDDGIQVVGVPKTIDGDVQVRDADGHVLCAISFGGPRVLPGYLQSLHGLQFRPQVLAYLQGHGAFGQPPGPRSGPADPRQHDPDR